MRSYKILVSSVNEAKVLDHTLRNLPIDFEPNITLVGEFQRERTFDTVILNPYGKTPLRSVKDNRTTEGGEHLVLLAASDTSVSLEYMQTTVHINYTSELQRIAAELQKIRTK
jgi:hypothetical protein